MQELDQSLFVFFRWALEAGGSIRSDQEVPAQLANSHFEILPHYLINTGKKEAFLHQIIGNKTFI